MRLTLARSLSLAFLAAAFVPFASTACSDAGGGSGDPNDVFGEGGSFSNGGSAANSSGGTTSGGSTSGGSSSGGNGAVFNFDGGQQDGTIDPDSGCATGTADGELQPANLLFVIDRSGSMNCNLPPITTTADCESAPIQVDMGQPTKWEATRDALTAAVDALEASGNISVGVSMFPRDDVCEVIAAPDIDLALLDAPHNTSLDTFFQTVTPKGRTPLAGATILSYKHISEGLAQEFNAGNTNVLKENNFVVLLTDGAETCLSDDDANNNGTPDALENLLNVDVPNALEWNIRTFVIGAPGSEGARSLLSQIAKAGGTASSPTCTADPLGPQDAGDCHFDLTTSTDFAAELASTLEEISGSVLTCEFDVPANPTGGEVDLNRVNVTLTPENGDPVQLAQDNGDCENGADGWQYADNNTKIILCGNACETAIQPNAKVEIVLGCPIITK